MINRDESTKVWVISEGVNYPQHIHYACIKSNHIHAYLFQITVRKVEKCHFGCVCDMKDL